MDEISLNQRSILSGGYRGIAFEMNEPHDGYKWTYYVFLNLENFADRELAESLWLEGQTDERFPKRKYYDYYRNAFLTDLEFHGGITWYSKRFNSSDQRIIKIGCDYGHLWDEGKYYTQYMVLRDVQATIDDVHRKSQYLVNCQGNGNLYPEESGRYENSRFSSNEWLATK